MGGQGCVRLRKVALYMCDQSIRNRSVSRAEIFCEIRVSIWIHWYGDKIYPFYWLAVFLLVRWAVSRVLGNVPAFPSYIFGTISDRPVQGQGADQNGWGLTRATAQRRRVSDLSAR